MRLTKSAERSNLVRPRFPRWSLDLIFGIPGSTLRDCETDLESALALGPSHLSCYGLVYEKGTNLWKQWQAGQVVPVEEEVERQMYELVMDRLEGAGLAMYEISNYARSGEESRHNLVYWANEAYFGVGLGAARYVRGVRSVNTRDLSAYLRRIEAGESATGPSEALEPEARAPRNRGPDVAPDRAGARSQRLPDPDRLRHRSAGRPGAGESGARGAAGRRRSLPAVHARGKVSGRPGPAARLFDPARIGSSALEQLIGAGTQLENGRLEQTAARCRLPSGSSPETHPPGSR